VIQSAILGALNHLLDQADWARMRLIPFVGRQAVLTMPPWRLALTVTASGSFEPADGEEADVTVELPAQTPLLALQGVDRALAQARVTGNAEFATALSFVFRHLRWDAEEDLSRLVGDIAARRLVSKAQGLLSWQAQAADRLARNVSEFLIEEAALAVPGGQVHDFSRDVAELREEVARLERRLGRLGAA
jgi:ubiquinone biosynthesis protein UbiJ